VCVCVCVRASVRARVQRENADDSLSLCVFERAFSIFESRARFCCESDEFALAKKKFEEIQNFEISRLVKNEQQQNKELLRNSIIAIHTKLNHYIKLL